MRDKMFLCTISHVAPVSNAGSCHKQRAVIIETGPGCLASFPEGKAGLCGSSVTEQGAPGAAWHVASTAEL